MNPTLPPTTKKKKKEATVLYFVILKRNCFYECPFNIKKEARGSALGPFFIMFVCLQIEHLELTKAFEIRKKAMQFYRYSLPSKIHYSYGVM